ncbi:MAG: hypothetical protein DCC52_07090 [Chloroflexi bacterium]|nr:MAG: hypothetical protein DCC52_07090 [Chloroflexota bacterium]
MNIKTAGQNGRGKTPQNLKMTKTQRRALERKKTMRRFLIGAAVAGLLLVGARANERADFCRTVL